MLSIILVTHVLPFQISGSQSFSINALSVNESVSSTYIQIFQTAQLNVGSYFKQACLHGYKE